MHRYISGPLSLSNVMLSSCCQAKTTNIRYTQNTCVNPSTHYTQELLGHGNPCPEAPSTQFLCWRCLELCSHWDTKAPVTFTHYVLRSQRLCSVNLHVCWVAVVTKCIQFTIIPFTLDRRPSQKEEKLHTDLLQRRHPFTVPRLNYKCLWRKTAWPGVWFLYPCGKVLQSIWLFI